MSEEIPDAQGWSEADIASMLTTRDEMRSDMPDFYGLSVDPSPGFHPGADSYVVDPDYFDILGLEEPEDLIKRKDSVHR